MIITHFSVAIICDGKCGRNTKFAHRTERACYSAARAAGWKLRPARGFAMCPACVNKGIKLPV